MSSKLTQRKKADDKAEKGKGSTATATDEDKARYTKLIEGLAEKTPEKVQPYAIQAAPHIAQVLVLFQAALPYIFQAYAAIQVFVAKLPEHALLAALGVCVCFFGGVFPATIAAFEAYRLCGGIEALQHLKGIWEELAKVKQASAEDDKADNDNNGTADVDEISPKELVKRKATLALKTIEPEKLNNAMTGIYHGWVAVIATLKLEFAWTITLGQVLGEKLYTFASRLEPGIKAAVAEEYHKWVPVGVRWACKVIAISVAWWMARIASALHSAIRGGQMFAKYILIVVDEKGIELPAMAKNEKLLGWAVAGCGLLFQLVFRFSVPFPLNLVLWPVNIVEWFVVYSVNK